MLFRKWISATYGKTEWEKFAEMLSTRERMHAALDVLGIGVEAVDVVNAVIYLTEGDFGNAALSGISAFLLVGELIGKSAKGAKYLAKGADLAKLVPPGVNKLQYSA